MTIELWALLGAAAILWIAIFAQQIALDKAVGAKYALSNREQDHSFEGATRLHGRLTRTVRNHVEGLSLFAPLILTASAADVSNVWTQYAAIAFFITRLLHFVFYAAGITPFRSFAWGVGFFFALGRGTAPTIAKSGHKAVSVAMIGFQPSKSNLFRKSTN